MFTLCAITRQRNNRKPAKCGQDSMRIDPDALNADCNANASDRETDGNVVLRSKVVVYYIYHDRPFLFLFVSSLRH